MKRWTQAGPGFAGLYGRPSRTRLFQSAFYFRVGYDGIPGSLDATDFVGPRIIATSAVF
jgi:hypothetical protein